MFEKYASNFIKTAVQDSFLKFYFMISTGIDLYAIAHVKVDFIPVLKMWVLPILGRFVWSTYFVQCVRKIFDHNGELYSIQSRYVFSLPISSKKFCRQSFQNWIVWSKIESIDDGDFNRLLFRANNPVLEPLATVLFWRN